MKKALRPSWRKFFIELDGEETSWSTRQACKVIDEANNTAMARRSTKSNQGWSAHDYLFSWLSRLHHHKITATMIEELNTKLEPFRYKAKLKLKDDNSAYWQPVGIISFEAGAETGAAYVFAHLLAAGALDALRQCGSKDCGRFYLGPRNQKWCSKSCGSRDRVRRKRRRDR